MRAENTYKCQEERRSDVLLGHLAHDHEALEVLQEGSGSPGLVEVVVVILGQAVISDQALHDVLHVRHCFFY